MLKLSNYQITEQLHEGVYSIIYRAYRQIDNQSVIIKALKQSYPTPEDIAHFKREYDMVHALNNDVQGVVKIFGLEKHENTWFMVFEKIEGESLTQYITQQSIEIADFLRLAIRLTDILEGIHRHRVIHKDITPSNILWNPKTDQLKIIDFGISTRLSQEKTTVSDINQLEGTLAYISPEQTGRMNRTMDYRSDFYSLGATFYQLLTQQLPFEAEDAMEVVHCHLAKMPPPPHELNAQIPPMISNIILKLMAKTAEDRYQSALGLKADLQQCLAQFETNGQITEFELGQVDMSSKFQIPKKLYGREQEIALFLNTFEKISVAEKQSKSAEMMLVAGYSGIGKSALVQEIYKPLTEKKGYFIAGKFEQFQRNIPYSAVVNAFSDLVRQLLTESEQQLTQWQEKLRQALGTNGQIIIDVIPEVELIIGKQPPVPELAPTETQNRFKLVFQNFIGVFCQKSHPLVIFLDDLQWADSATLALIQLIMTNAEMRHLFLIGAYRDNEVNPTHPLRVTLSKLRKRDIVINQINLGPLTIEHVTQLIADTLHSEPSIVKPLSHLVMQKTGGNPFFVNQFLTTLYDEKLLTFISPEASFSDNKKGHWQWDMPQIQAINMTDNVIELMVGKLKKLAFNTQKALRLAACIGNRFHLNQLAIIHEKSARDTLRDLISAIEEELIIPIEKSSAITGEILESTQELPLHFDSSLFTFLHDRVQQAAYTLIDDIEKPNVHLKIGYFLLANTPKTERSEKIFDIVNHLNLGALGIPITASLERNKKEPYSRFHIQLTPTELAQLNLEAGQKSLLSNAFGPAYDYFSQGIINLPPNSWSDYYQLTLNLHIGSAEASGLDRQFDEMKMILDLSLPKIDDVMDKIKLYQLLIFYYHTHSLFREAVETAVHTLAQLGEAFPKQPNTQDLIEALNETNQWIEKVGYDNLTKLPDLQNQQKLAALMILHKALYPAYFAVPEILGLFICRLVTLTLQYGHSRLTPFAFSAFSVLLNGGLSDMQTGTKFGELANQLFERGNDTYYKAGVYNLNIGLSQHFYKPIRSCVDPLIDGYLSFAENGDAESCAYCLINSYMCAILGGYPLEKLGQKFEVYIRFAPTLKQEQVIHQLHIWTQVVVNLRGESDFSAQLKGQFFDIDTMLPWLYDSKNFNTSNYANVAQLILYYTFDAYEQAYATAVKTEPYLPASTGKAFTPNYNFYYSLTLAALYSTVSEETQTQYWEKLTANQQQMKLWADNCPSNFLHKYLLVEAEMARIRSNDLAAIDYYDQAIESANTYGFIQDEALANELTAKFWLAKGKERYAKSFMLEAHYGYTLWGAKRKVKELEEKYPQFAFQTTTTEVNTLKTIDSLPSLTATRKIPTAHQGELSLLDLETILKSSQAIAGEVYLEKLLVTLMNIMIENTGAEQGFLLSEKESQWSIDAEGTMEDSQAQISANGRQKDSQEANSVIAMTIVNYVARTKEALVLNNASHKGDFIQDPYILTTKPKSVLCVPLVNQGQLSGIVYLENNLVSGAFTPARVKTVQLLGAQAAISLDNARLYEKLAEYNRTLEAKVAERTQELSQALENLKTTQEELVQSEKMAALGQLIAGIAHEVNTPLGAIRASIGNIADALNESMQQLPALFEKLTPELQQQFFALTEATLKNRVNLTTKEERKVKRKIMAQLEDYDIDEDDAYEMAETLVEMGFCEEIEPFVSLFQSPDNELILQAAYNLSIQQNHCQNIINAVERASKVVFALKNYARQDHTGQKLQANITESIELVLTLYHNQIKQGIEIITHYEEVPNILCYPDELNQVWTNLIHNAIQAMDNQGTLEITVLEQNPHIVVNMTDHGKGIPDDIKPRIFEPFFTTKPAGEGSGLGLDIVQKIINKHQGTIEVESQPGKTTFSVFLPIEDI
jgi:predicted ATPase/signal transduction histidine kinase/tRNA A-37 threonylcarbamoyl transferase component Bud32